MVDLHLLIHIRKNLKILDQDLEEKNIRTIKEKIQIENYDIKKFTFKLNYITKNFNYI